MPGEIMRHVITAAIAFALLGSVSAQAQGGGEASFLSRFEGNWSGAGHVKKDAQSDTWQVSCRMSGQPGVNRISIDGNCRAAVIVNRAIGAHLVYDPASGRYSGTYIGSVVGPARLSGQRVGDAVKLTITWPKLVNGDTKAAMTVHNAGNGQLRITVADNLVPGGPVQTTSEIRLAH
jgi:hypothetical protein